MNLKVVLNIGNVEKTMNQAVIVRQGNCMAPVLFLFMVMPFAESLEKEWSKAGSDMIKMRKPRIHHVTLVNLPVTNAIISQKEVFFPHFVFYTLIMDHLILRTMIR